jgi:hypothetical protein
MHPEMALSSAPGGSCGQTMAQTSWQQPEVVYCFVYVSQTWNIVWIGSEENSHK